MPRGKSKYTDKQERKASHIAEGYKKTRCAKRRSRTARLGHHLTDHGNLIGPVLACGGTDEQSNSGKHVA